MRKHFFASFIVLIFFALSGCLCWPPNGTGGVAEQYYAPMYPEPVAYNGPLTPDRIIQHRLLVARNFLGYLEVKGARACFPGIWRIANEQANKTTRELAG